MVETLNRTERTKTLEREFAVTPEQLDLLTELIASVGNSEAKAACLLTMKRGELYTPWGLKKAFINQTGHGWEQSERSLKDYCAKTFEPIGLVARSVEIDSGKATEKVYFQTTDKGENLGKPLAAYMIDFSNRYDISLFRLFGEIHVPNKESNPRPPISRLRILTRLVTTPTNRLVDFENELGIKGVVIKEHLKALYKAGFISGLPDGYQRHFNYQPVQNEKTQAVFNELIPTLIGFVQQDPPATNKVMSAFYKLVGSENQMGILEPAVSRAKQNSSQFERYQNN